MIDIDTEEFKTLYRLLTIAELAKKLKCSRITVCRLAKSLELHKKAGRKKKIRLT